MKTIGALITVASWEERFMLGLSKSIENYSPKTIICFYYKEYAEQSKKNRDTFRKIARQKKIKLVFEELNFASEKHNWNIVESIIESNTKEFKKILIDITTMPRDAIFNILYFLENLNKTIDYIYYKPRKYNDDWLSRDPAKPRLILKQSGITKLGANTVLVIITGFDAERTEQLINFFEPSVTLIGFQKGSQFNNRILNHNKHKKQIDRWRGQTEVKTFTIDAYSDDNGLSVLISKIKRYLKSSNIVISSLGPKTSAIALYQLCKAYPEIALSYAPSNEFNKDYSSGVIDVPIYGKL